MCRLGVGEGGFFSFTQAEYSRGHSAQLMSELYLAQDFPPWRAEPSSAFDTHHELELAMISVNKPSSHRHYSIELGSITSNSTTMPMLTILHFPSGSNLREKLTPLGIKNY